MLTTESRCEYTGSLKTEHTAFTPRQRVFFMPMAWMRAENTQYQPKPLCSAFSESTPLLILNGDLLKKEHKMTNAISVFKFNQNKIRTQAINGEPWFCLIDCRAALGIKGSLKKVSLSEKGVTICHSLTNGGKQELNFINEPNLYRLIFRSNKPQAQAFADWVYSEVLPSVRKTGSYGTPAVDMKAIGGMVKRCVNKALTDFLSAELPASDDVLRQKYYNVTDKDMAETLQRWYWSRNYDVRQAIDALTRENDELKCKLLMIKKAVN